MGRDSGACHQWTIGAHRASFAVARCLVPSCILAQRCRGGKEGGGEGHGRGAGVYCISAWSLKRRRLCCREAKVNDLAIIIVDAIRFLSKPPGRVCFCYLTEHLLHLLRHSGSHRVDDAFTQC